MVYSQKAGLPELRFNNYLTHAATEYYSVFNM